MKILAGIVVLLLIGFYVFVPGKISIAKSTYTRCAATAVIRSLSDTSNWAKWWPKNGTTGSDGSFIYKNIKYLPGDKYYNGISVSIESGKLKLSGRLNVFHLTPDSTAIQWIGNSASSLNPIKRMNQFNESKEIQDNLAEVLHNLGVFLGDRKNIYGISIIQTSTRDTILIFTSFNFSQKPTYAQIYSLIDNLKKYALSRGSVQNGDPLLNIKSSGSGSYLTKVAIPINKYVPGSDKIESKRMVPGNFLMSEVVGGESAVHKAFAEMQLFMQDYGKSEIAIPFEYLVTNRLVETDSSKWVTKIYQPIYQ